MHWNSRITLCLILLYCCVPIQSHPRGLPHVLFLLLYVAVFAYTAHTLHIAVLCTCHNNMYPDPPQRKYTQLWDIMYHITPAPLNCSLYIHIYEREFEPGGSVPFFFFLDLPSFCQFCWLALSGFISDPVFINPLLRYNIAQNSQYYVSNSK